MSASAKEIKRRKRARDFSDELSDEASERPAPVRRVTRLSLSSPAKSEAVGTSRSITGHPRDRSTTTAAFRRQLDDVSTPQPRPVVLPTRLFADNLIPSKGRINSYSKPEYLLYIKDVLDGTPEFGYLKDSVFGSLFKIQIREAVLSGKLVHQFLCRSLVTRKKHELWFVFGGKPIKFSLKEFAFLTGLNCDPYPVDNHLKATKKVPSGKKSFWNRLIGDVDHIYIADVVDILRADRDELPHNRMSAGRRLRLALLVLVEGVLIPSSSTGRASREVVEMLQDLDYFMEYPWGRWSFELTLEMVLCGYQVNPTVDSLRDKLSNSHLTTKGFTLAFQLLVLKTVPLLVDILPDETKLVANFIDTSIKVLPKFNRFHNDNIQLVERTGEVTSILDKGFPLESDDFTWTDEVEDLGVDNMESRLRSGHVFTNEEFTAGGVCRQRETVVALPRMKQGTLRRMMGVKKQEVAESSKKKGKKTDDCSDCSHGHPTVSLDSVFEEKRLKFIAAVDVLVAELKAEVMSELSAIGKKNFERNDGKMKIEIKGDGNLKSGKNPVDSDGMGGSGSSEVPVVDIEYKSSEGTGDCSPIVAAKNDDVDTVVNKVLTDLSMEDGHADDRGQPNNCLAIVVVEDKPVSKYGFPHVGNEEMECLESRDCPAHAEDVLTYTASQESEKAVDVQYVGTNVDLNIDTRLDDGGLPENEHMDTVTGAQSSDVDEFLNMDGGGSDNGSKDSEDSDSVKDEKDDDVHVPVRTKRERKMPQKFINVGEPALKATGSKDASLSSSSVGTIDDYNKRQFLAKLRAYRQREYIINGHPQPRSFFKAIYKPTNHVNTEHMEVMLSCVWRRLCNVLLDRRTVILDTWFAQLLVSDHGRFSRVHRGAAPFNWNSTLRKYVLGDVPHRPGGVAWFVNVDHVYAPFQLGKDHWAALCIDLKEGIITIYDSIVNLNSETKVAKLMKPICEILPAIIAEVAMVEPSVYPNCSKFVYKRAAAVSQNNRTGDCGPMSVRFIELRAQGQSIEGFTNEYVDNIRMMYAIEVYSEFVETLG